MGPALLDKLNYFGWLSNGPTTSPPEEGKHAMRALPSNWYTSQKMYDLERRAIFSRKWQLISHKARFNQAGDWIKFDLAGFQIVVCRDRYDNINAFHNVCRHRAFPVVEGNQGTSRIFSCKYHGWSYGLNGKLAKAPGYQELEGFDKDKNGLLPVHIHIDVNGFIWVNLDGGKVPEIAWEDDFAGIDQQERYNQFNFDDYEFDHFWEMSGDYNWKILADNYNECYHCATTHPDIGAVANLQSYSVDTNNGKIIHNPATTDEQAANGMTVASTYYFPNVSTNIT
jgi:phenylpropionate dioxygenase-like ring-hydroxylating dioxygenase large terminal subunit